MELFSLYFPLTPTLSFIPFRVRRARELNALTKGIVPSSRA